MAAIGRLTPSFYSTTNLPLFADDAHADAEVSAAALDGDDAWTGATESAYITMLAKASVPAGQSEFAIGHRLLVETLPAAEKILLALLALDETIQCCVSLRTDGKLSIWKGDLTGDELDRSDSAIPNGSGTVLDFGLKGLIDGVAGALDAYVGLSGVPTSWSAVASAAGVDTRGHASENTWRGFTLGLAPDVFQNHLYWRDGRLTDGGLIVLTPGTRVGKRTSVSAGGLNNWYPNTGTIQAALDDADQDGDTTIAQSNPAPAATSFSVGLTTVGDHAVINGLSTMVLVKNAAASPDLRFQTLIVTDVPSDPLVHLGPLVQMTDGAWRPAWFHQAVNPRTGQLFTVDDVNAQEAGGATDIS